MSEKKTLGRCSTSNPCLTFLFSVTYEERYSDLEKSIYLPSPTVGGFSKKTLEYEDNYDKNTEEFVRLHPCAQLVPKQVKNHIEQCHFQVSFCLRVISCEEMNLS